MGHSSAITARFEAAFERIHIERMAGVPVLNAALSVAMTGLRGWHGYQVGVLVTPWFINAVLVSDEGDEPAVQPGAKRSVQLPAGLYEFIRSHEDGLGGFWMCSLFSPVVEFPDQETAVAVAEMAFCALMDVNVGTDEVEKDMVRIWRGELPEPGESLPADVAAEDTAVPYAESKESGGGARKVSRRSLLTAGRNGGGPA